MEKVWFVGDQFVFDSYEKYYKQRASDQKLYVQEHYEISAFNNDGFNCLDRNIVSRLRNKLAMAINDQVILPKFIIVVPDDDIISFIQHQKFGFSEAMGRLVDFIMVAWDRFILTQKENLPTKAKKSGGWPKII